MRNGRRPYKQIAESLDVTENTIRSRVSKLIEEGALDIAGLVDPEKIPHHRVVMIGVKIIPIISDRIGILAFPK